MTFDQFKSLKNSEYVRPTGRLSHNPTSILIQVLINYLKIKSIR